MSNHTPGPWFTEREGFSTVYIEARIGGGMIQEVAACGPTAEGSDQQDANASLIAASPDLLKALKQVMSWIDNWTPEFSNDPDWPTDRDAARSAIEQAESKP